MHDPVPQLTLFAGLLLPWIVGYVWLANIESFFNNGTATGRLRRAGYGFFLGYAVLYVLVLANSSLAGRVSFSVVMLSLAVLAVAGGLLLYVRSRTRKREEVANPPNSAISEYSTKEKMLLLVLVLWIATHLVFAAIELLTLPVYPWDAWLVWVYRAKAWFYAGNMVDFVSATEWINSPE